MTANKAPAKSRETAFGASLRVAMLATDGFRALADSLGVPYETLKAACAQHQVLVVGSRVLEPLDTLVTHRDLSGGEVWPSGDDRPTGGADMVDFACELHRDTVKALKAGGLDMTVSVIAAKDEDGDAEFWSADDGWVSEPTGATLFYGYEISGCTMPEPSGETPAEWKLFTVALQEHENPTAGREPERA